MKNTGVKRVLAAAFVAGVAALSSGASSAGTTPAVVAAAHFSFLPSTIVITAGSELTFTNLDASGHSVTARDQRPGTYRELFDSGVVATGASVPVEGVSELAPNAAGYEFVCVLHSTMQGRLIVI